MSMTQTENAKCHFCQGPATAVKLDVELQTDDDGNDVEIISRLPIDEACNAYWYDGTETYPKLQPLA